MRRRDWADIYKGYDFITKSDREFLCFFYQGLFTSLKTDRTKEFFTKEKIDYRYLIYFYQRLGLLCSKDSLDESINTIDERYLPFFYQGFFRNLFVEHGLLISAPSLEKFLAQEILLTMLDGFSEDNPKYHLKEFYQGLGIELGIDTFGYIGEMGEFLQALKDKGVEEDFYYGYGIGLSLRYGKNLEEIQKLINYNVPKEFERFSLEAVELYCSVLLPDQS